jgi:hypothetical protein
VETPADVSVPAVDGPKPKRRTPRKITAGPDLETVTAADDHQGRLTQLPLEIE